jgi:hypothetical protein
VGIDGLEHVPVYCEHAGDVGRGKAIAGQSFNLCGPWPVDVVDAGVHRNGASQINDAPSLNRGFLDALEDWRLSVDNARLVIIDVLQRVKPAGNPNQNSYESDYSALAGLQRWATDRRVAVVALHHTRKGGADDPLEALSGSNGLSACADYSGAIRTASRSMSAAGTSKRRKAP